MTTSEIAPSSENEPLAAIASNLQSLVESLIELGVMTHDFQGTLQSHTALTHKTNQVVSLLSGLTNSPFAHQYPIPIDVINYIEDGRNPDIYTREFVEVTARTNAKLKGSILAFRKLRDILGDKLVQEFPHLENGVEKIKSRTGRL